MNTTSNFSSVNGWCMPGSGTWVSQDAEDFYIDENGDLWVPCLCDEEAADAGDAFDCENDESEACA